MIRLIRPLLLGLAVSVLAGHALAHAMLERAAPRVGSVGNASPAEIRLQFSEAVEPALSHVALKTGDGRVVALASESVLPSDHHIMIAKPAAALAPGIYHVVWKVVSVDTHRTEGDYCFTVGR
jgi:methionine-rich copper-binding protein CopC